MTRHDYRTLGNDYGKLRMCCDDQECLGMTRDD